MLFEFHRVQNGKKPGTIHATFLISGIKRREESCNGVATQDGDGDDCMQSSPFMASSVPLPEGTGESSLLTITLVKEEDLDRVRLQYDHISSIHMYSLGPHTLKNLQLLSDCTREIRETCSAEDPLQSYPTYGIITNPLARRRPLLRPRPTPTAVPAPAPAKATLQKSKLNEVVEAKASSSNNSEQKPQSSTTANDFFGKGAAKGKGKTAPKAQPKENASGPSSKEVTPAPALPPTLSRKESSNIFKSFAKAKPKLNSEESRTSVSTKEEETMNDIFDDTDDEEEEEFTPAPSHLSKKEKESEESGRKSRKDREAALRKMMDDEDEEDEESPAVETPVEEEKEPEEKKEVELMVAVSGGRRRGRRRIMKKKTVRNDEGFLGKHSLYLLL